MFLTRRSDLADISRTLSHISVVVSINAASNESLARIVNREDTLIEDQMLRERLLQHSSHLGLLIRMVEEIAVQHGACKQGN